AALADLRRADARAVQAAADRLDAPIDDDSFIWLQPTVDGKVLPRAPQAVFRAGEGADIPVIIGVSARELGLHGDLKSQLKAA
ncbi:carboxylesterase family protein, partial [Klebsiella pneumoniae]|nr:carboxylesterase family protein [Klebsiella pneumoniae]